MRIERPELIERLDRFARENHGVLTGAPGVGKTHAVLELHRRWEETGVPHLLVPVDKLGSATDSEIRDVLGIPGDLIQFAQDQIPGGEGGRGVVVFDAFDAARSEATRERVLQLIRRAKAVSFDRWTVLVTVRIYDVTHSRALRELFRVRGVAGDSAGLEDVRHFQIPQLTNEEVAVAVEQIEGLADVLAGASASFAHLLHLPFNLWLLERILASPGRAVSLRGIASEVQLLGLYWNRRILAADDPDLVRHLLERVVQRLVSSYALSTRREDVYSPEIASAWREALSSGLLELSGTTQQRVGFGHNILFDYAVTALLLDDEPRSVESFIAEDPARPFFLRPSITYFFTRLWYEAREMYWRVTWRTLASTHAHVRLTGRVIPPAVFVAESETAEDFKLLLDYLDSGSEGAPEFLLRVFQALRVRGLVPAELWAELCLQAVLRPRRDYLWNAVTVTIDLLEAAPGSIRVRDLAGEVARVALRWVLANRRDGEERWVDSLGALWAAPLVAKTIASSPEESEQLLTRILGLVEEPGFPIEYFFRLSNEVPRLVKYAPKFVGALYRTVFGHVEASEETTSFGTPILPLRSTRRQDFGMCQYSLASEFDVFLGASLDEAVRAALACVDAAVLREQVLPYLLPGKTVADVEREFTFRRRRVRLIDDSSYVWAASGRHDDAVQLLDKVIGRLEDACRDDRESEIEVILDAFTENAHVAVAWRELLSAGARNPSMLARRLFEIANTDEVMRGGLIYEVTEFVAAAYPFWDQSMRAEFERTMLGIEAADSEQEAGELHRSVDRIIAALPPGLLELPDSRERRSALEAAGKLPSNEPLARFGGISIGPYSREEWLEDQGVQVNASPNRNLLTLREQLDEAHGEWQNRRPPAAWAEEHAVKLRLVQAAGISEEAGEVDHKVVALIRGSVAKAAQLIARSEGELSAPTLELARDVLLESAVRVREGESAAIDAEFKHPAWSTTERTEAAQGLAWLIIRGSNGQVLDAIEALTQDPDPPLRFLMVSDLFRIRWAAEGRFWHIANRIAANEASTVVLMALCGSLDRLPSSDAPKIARILEVLDTRNVVPRDRSDQSRAYAHILARTALSFVDDWAVARMNRLADDPSHNLGLVQALVFDALAVITPRYLDDPDVRPISMRAIEWVRRVIQGCSSLVPRLPELQLGSSGAEERVGEVIYRIIDQIAARLYFNTQHDETTPDERELTGTYYFVIRPIIEDVIQFGQLPGSVLMAPTAHHLMELFNRVLEVDVPGVLRFAAGVASASERASYNLDSMAVREVVTLSERILADHRAIVAEEGALEDLVKLLDTFARAGWPDAVRLLWRLDEIFR